MQEPTRNARTFKKRFWNQGMERTQYTDRHRTRKLRHRWSQYCNEKRKKYNGND